MARKQNRARQGCSVVLPWDVRDLLELNLRRNETIGDGLRRIMRERERADLDGL